MLIIYLVQENYLMIGYITHFTKKLINYLLITQNINPYLKVGGIKTQPQLELNYWN